MSSAVFCYKYSNDPELFSFAHHGDFHKPQQQRGSAEGPLLSWVADSRDRKEGLEAEGTERPPFEKVSSRWLEVLIV